MALTRRPLHPARRHLLVRSSHSPDAITVCFDDDHAVADAGLILAATLAEGPMLQELVNKHVDLGGAPGAANAGDRP
jgi:hypothetical protein